jgi:hypothetical protein
MKTIKIPFYEDYEYVIVDDSVNATAGVCASDICYCSEKYIEAWTLKLVFFFILFFII